MKLQFDSEQPYQKEVVAAVVDLFDGQPQGVEFFLPMISMMPDEVVAGLRTRFGARLDQLAKEEVLEQAILSETSCEGKQVPFCVT